MSNYSELIQRVKDRYEVEDVIEILELYHAVDNEDVFDLDMDTLCKVFRQRILRNIERFDVQ